MSLQYEIKVIIRAVDKRDDSEDAYMVMQGEWDNISDALTDLAHHVDGTRPDPQMFEKIVLPDSMTKETKEDELLRLARELGIDLAPYL